MRRLLVSLFLLLLMGALPSVAVHAQAPGYAAPGGPPPPSGAPPTAAASDRKCRELRHAGRTEALPADAAGAAALLSGEPAVARSSLER